MSGFVTWGFGMVLVRLWDLRCFLQHHKVKRHKVSFRHRGISTTLRHVVFLFQLHIFPVWSLVLGAGLGAGFVGTVLEFGALKASLQSAGFVRSRSTNLSMRSLSFEYRLDLHGISFRM